MPTPLPHRLPTGRTGHSRARTLLVWTATLWAALLHPHPAGAHEFWLSPTRYSPRPHEPVEVAAIAGTGFRGEAKPFASTRCVRWVARTDRTLDLGRVAMSGEPIWARFAPSDDRGVLMAYESSFTPIELPPAEFDAYLALQGLDGPLVTRRRLAAEPPGRERYRRCAKAWLSGADAARATRALGLPLEIVPGAAPGASSALRVRVLAEGRPLADALVKAWRTAVDATGLPIDPTERDSVPPAWQGRTDAHGEATIATDEPGEWMLSVVRMVACRETAAADWESTWASLTFQRPASVSTTR